MNSPAKILFDLNICIKIADTELRHSRMLGAGHVEAFNSSFRALDDALDLANMPMPELVLTRFRPLERRS